jgi:hypothetical protein
MYTNGFTGSKFLSTIHVRDFAGKSVEVLMCREFDAQSESITLQGESAILHTEAARLDISDIDATIRVTGI